MADLCNDRAVKDEVLGVDLRDDAVYSDVIVRFAAFLLAFQVKPSAAIRDARRAEIILADPLQRKTMSAEQQGARLRVVDDGFLRSDRHAQTDD